MKKVDLPRKLTKPLDALVSALKDIYGDGLVSVVLYGSAASGEHAGKNSNMNVAIVLNDTRLANIAKSSRIFRRLELQAVNPVFFTEKYLKSSTDVFPIEFLDMKENYSIVYGKDVLQEITVDLKNLRFQCEQELKSKIIRLKTAYLFDNNSSSLKQLLYSVFTSSLHVLRNLLRLKGRVAPYSKDAVIKELADSFGVDRAAFSRILDAKNGKVRLNNKEAQILLGELIDALEGIAETVDKL